MAGEQWEARDDVLADVIAALASVQRILARVVLALEAELPPPPPSPLQLAPRDLAREVQRTS